MPGTTRVLYTCGCATDEACLPASCWDQVRNGDEEGVDCGGPSCPFGCPDATTNATTNTTTNTTTDPPPPCDRQTLEVVNFTCEPNATDYLAENPDAEAKEYYEEQQLQGCDAACQPPRLDASVKKCKEDVLTCVCDCGCDAAVDHPVEARNYADCESTTDEEQDAWCADECSSNHFPRTAGSMRWCHATPGKIKCDCECA